jgi:hypothetical protein
MCGASFRELPGVRAYYEPWHEQLERLTPRRSNVETPDNSGLRHPGGARPYLQEFEAVLDPAGGVRGYQDRLRPGPLFGSSPTTSDLASRPISRA